MEEIGTIYINKDMRKTIEILVNGKPMDINGLESVDIHIEFGVIDMNLNYRKSYRMI